jgi:serine-type D-Ala-D-Ala carboxypeptidase/endopeptidase (penicillin-binding protein 4)
MWSRLFGLTLALLLLPAPALAGIKEKIAAMAPSALVLVLDDKGNELIAQNADQPFAPASRPSSTWARIGCSMCAVAAIPS